MLSFICWEVGFGVDSYYINMFINSINPYAYNSSYGDVLYPFTMPTGFCQMIKNYNNSIAAKSYIKYLYI